VRTSPQQEVLAWLSVLGRGLGLTFGLVGLAWEVFNGFQQPYLIPLFTGMMFSGPVTESVAGQVIAYLIKTGRITLQIGPFIKFEMTEPLNGLPMPPLPVTTIVAIGHEDELEENEPTTRSSKESHSPNSPNSDTDSKSS
jgi:hypothetical protein